MKSVFFVVFWSATMMLAAASAAESPSSDAVRVAVQGICPVSGEKLGSMGQPVKVRIGKEEVFLCCKGCLTRKVQPEHWVTIHTNFAKAQGICPVMNSPLPEKPKWTIVEGRIVYVCCPPCTAKIEADPAPYLKAVDERYAAYLKSQTE